MYLGCVHAQPNKSDAPVFVRMPPATSANSRPRSAAVSLRTRSPTREIGVNRKTSALRRAEGLPEDVADAVERAAEISGQEGALRRHGHVLYGTSAYLIEGRVEQDPRRVLRPALRHRAGHPPGVAQRIAREHADPHDPEALTFRYQKDANSEGDYVDLVISGTDETRVGLVLRRLRAHGYEDLTVEWLADEDPPHLISVLSTDAGLPAPPSRAREVLKALGLHVPLVPDAEEGFYKTLLLEFFPYTRSVTVADSEWTILVLRRG